MGFYSCVAKSSAGEATWSSWLRRRGEFCLSLCFASPFILASKVVSTSQSPGLIYLPNAMAMVVGRSLTQVMPLGGRRERVGQFTNHAPLSTVTAATAPQLLREGGG